MVTKIDRIMRANSLEAKLKQIGSGLSELRKKKGYDTIRDFAKAYKLPEIQYWRIENGKTNLTLKSLTKLLKIHKLTLEDFFCSL
jgi:transcriptional regulator with XRE-family HTH domain